MRMGVPLQSERRADLVFDIPLIGEVEKLPAVAEDDEVRRSRTGLGHIIDLQTAALVGRRLYARLRVGEHVVEKAGRDAHGALVVHEVHKLKNALGALAGERGDEEDGAYVINERSR